MFLAEPHLLWQRPPFLGAFGAYVLGRAATLKIAARNSATLVSCLLLVLSKRREAQLLTQLVYRGSCSISIACLSPSASRPTKFTCVFRQFFAAYNSPHRDQRRHYPLYTRLDRHESRPASPRLWIEPGDIHSRDSTHFLAER